MRFLTKLTAALMLSSAMAAPAYAGGDQGFAWLPIEMVEAFATGTSPVPEGKTGDFVGTDWVTWTQKEEEGITYNVMTYSGQTAPAEDGSQELLFVAWAIWDAETGRPASPLTIEAKATNVSEHIAEEHSAVIDDNGNIVASIALASLPMYLKGGNVCEESESYDVKVPENRHVQKDGPSTAWSCTMFTGFTTVWTEIDDSEEAKWADAVLGNFSDHFAIWANYEWSEEGTEIVSGLNFELQHEDHDGTIEMDGLNACVGAGEATYYNTDGAETQNPGALPATEWTAGELRWTMFHGPESPWGGNEKFVRAYEKDFWNFDANGEFIAGRINGGKDLVEAGTDYVLPFEDVCTPDAAYVK